MIKQNIIIILLLVFGTFAFCFNYLIETKFDRYNIFNQRNVVFHTDPNWKLNCFVKGISQRAWPVVHPNLTNYFHTPIRLVAKLIIYFLDGNWEKELKIRKLLALLIVPIFSALNAMAIALIFIRLKFTLLQVCMVTMLSLFSFTQIIFGSMPETFALNGFFITMCFLIGTHFLESKRLNWVRWIILGAFGMGITITNIFVLIIIFFTSNFSVNKDKYLTIKNTIRLINIVTLLTFSLSIGSSLLFGKKPSFDNIKGAGGFTRQFIREDFWGNSSKYPVAVASSITPTSIKILSDPKMKEYVEAGRGKYHHRFTIAYYDIGQFSIIVIIMITIGITSVGAINLLKKHIIIKSLAISSLLMLTYNWLFHAFWGSEYFLYSQHWICSLIILMSGIFLSKKPYFAPITSIFLAFLVYVIFNNLVALNDIFTFIRNYSS